MSKLVGMKILSVHIFVKNCGDDIIFRRNIRVYIFKVRIGALGSNETIMISGGSDSLDESGSRVVVKELSFVDSWVWVLAQQMVVSSAGKGERTKPELLEL